MLKERNQFFTFRFEGAGGDLEFHAELRKLATPSAR